MRPPPPPTSAPAAAAAPPPAPSEAGSGDRLACVAAELATLERIAEVLQAEDVALRRFDLAGIEAAAAAKLELDEQLQRRVAARRQASGSVGEELRLRHRSAVERVRALAEANVRRLQASSDAVGGLVRTLTGAQAPAYGRRAPRLVGARPILTAEIG